MPGNNVSSAKAARAPGRSNCSNAPNQPKGKQIQKKTGNKTMPKTRLTNGSVDQVISQLTDTMNLGLNDDSDLHTQEVNAPKQSRASRKREKRAAERRAQEEALSKAQSCAVNSIRAKESTKINEHLSARNLRLHEVPSDGDCLYLAVAHQLSLHGIGMDKLQHLVDTDWKEPPCSVTNGGDQPSSTRSLAFRLRHVTANHLRSHMDEFLPFLFNQETGEPMTDEEFRAYCTAVERPSTWGGQIEVRALANALDLPIEVLQAEGPAILIGEESGAPRITIIYHRHAFALGEHYNSCSPLSEDQ